MFPTSTDLSGAHLTLKVKLVAKHVASFEWQRRGKVLSRLEPGSGTETGIPLLTTRQKATVAAAN